jgi:hypothetical protein
MLSKYCGRLRLQLVPRSIEGSEAVDLWRYRHSSRALLHEDRNIDSAEKPISKSLKTVKVSQGFPGNVQIISRTMNLLDVKYAED